MYTTDPNDPRLAQDSKEVGEALLILPDDQRLVAGAYVPRVMVHCANSCFRFTVLPQLVAETFAAKPDFYTHMYCAHCKEWRLVREFNWKDGHKVGT